MQLVTIADVKAKQHQESKVRGAASNRILSEICQADPDERFKVYQKYHAYLSDEDHAWLLMKSLETAPLKREVNNRTRELFLGLVETAAQVGLMLVMTGISYLIAAPMGPEYSALIAVGALAPLLLAAACFSRAYNTVFRSMTRTTLFWYGGFLAALYVSGSFESTTVVNFLVQIGALSLLLFSVATLSRMQGGTLKT